MPNNIPPCVSKLSDCSTKAMQSTNLATGEMPCCSEWAKEIKDSTQCVCDNFKPYLSSLTDFFTLCKIDAPTCEGTTSTGNGNAANAISNQKNGAKKMPYSIGLLPALLLILT
ncbi:hypothetical protein BVRB_5g098160 [Beta vulgaris subsp. vulgaris]|nr:hypothetical protein BVRB_5g098160 [Beta vulgaris subsp. vulgaris]